MKGRTVILPGGSGGIGAVVADLVASRGGVPVIGCLWNVARAEDLRRTLSNRYGVDAPVVAGDILDEDVRGRFIEAAASAGSLYGLVPLVGEPARVPIDRATEDDMIAATRVNFIGPMLIARDFAARVRGSDSSIVLVSTMQAVGLFPGSVVYAAPKAALIHAGRILAREWGGAGRIRVNVVAPGVTRSGMAMASVEGGKYDPFIANDVIVRFGEADDVARAILYLLEPDNYVTGQVLTVDGGLTTRK
jgi:NAD(P)-dependent dehydrogenase (short-subunit alcohol dehydrogenase family)